MKSVVYRLKKECTKPGSRRSATYGVEIIEDGVQTEYIPCAFNKKRMGKKFIRVCKKYDVAPVHAADVIEDMLYDLNKKGNLNICLKAKS